MNALLNKRTPRMFAGQGSEHLCGSSPRGQVEGSGIIPWRRGWRRHVFRRQASPNVGRLTLPRILVG
jgi:hypothetical protein